MEITTKNLSELKLNPNNPRKISKDKMANLTKSVENFTKMLELRPIIYDEKGVIIGGNMRYLALKKLGYKDVPESWIKCVNNLTDDEKKQFTILDNGQFGEWDFEIVLDEFNTDDFNLEELGIDLPEEIITRGKRKERDEKYQMKKIEDYIEKYEILIECESELKQKELLTRFILEGLQCKAIIV